MPDEQRCTLRVRSSLAARGHRFENWRKTLWWCAGAIFNPVASRLAYYTGHTDKEKRSRHRQRVHKFSDQILRLAAQSRQEDGA